jgi:hypothetical protein
MGLFPSSGVSVTSTPLDPSERADSIHWGNLVEVKSKLFYDQWSVGQSILVSGHHLGHATKFSIPSMKFVFKQLRFFWYEAPSLTREVCNLLVQVLLGLPSIITI